MEISETSPFSMLGNLYKMMNCTSATAKNAATIQKVMPRLGRLAGLLMSPTMAAPTFMMNSMPTGTHVDQMATAMKRCWLENHKDTAVGPVTEHIPTPMPSTMRKNRNSS